LCTASNVEFVVERLLRVLAEKRAGVKREKEKRINQSEDEDKNDQQQDKQKQQQQQQQQYQYPHPLLISNFKQVDDIDAHEMALIHLISSLAEKFAPSNIWYIMTIVRLFLVGGDRVPKSEAEKLLSLLSEGNEDEEEQEQEGEQRKKKKQNSDSEDEQEDEDNNSQSMSQSQSSLSSHSSSLMSDLSSISAMRLYSVQLFRRLLLIIHFLPNQLIRIASWVIGEFGCNIEYKQGGLLQRRQIMRERKKKNGELQRQKLDKLIKKKEQEQEKLKQKSKQKTKQNKTEEQSESSSDSSSEQNSLNSEQKENEQFYIQYWDVFDQLEPEDIDSEINININELNKEKEKEQQEEVNEWDEVCNNNEGIQSKYIELSFSQVKHISNRIYSSLSNHSQQSTLLFGGRDDEILCVTLAKHPKLQQQAKISTLMALGKIEARIREEKEKIRQSKRRKKEFKINKGEKMKKKKRVDVKVKQIKKKDVVKIIIKPVVIQFVQAATKSINIEQSPLSIAFPRNGANEEIGVDTDLSFLTPIFEQQQNLDQQMNSNNQWNRYVPKEERGLDLLALTLRMDENYYSTPNEIQRQTADAIQAMSGRGKEIGKGSGGDWNTNIQLGKKGKNANDSAKYQQAAILFGAGAMPLSVSSQSSSHSHSSHQLKSSNSPSVNVSGNTGGVKFKSSRIQKNKQQNNNQNQKQTEQVINNEEDDDLFADKNNKLILAIPEESYLIQTASVGHAQSNIVTINPQESAVFIATCHVNPQISQTATLANLHSGAARAQQEGGSESEFLAQFPLKFIITKHQLQNESQNTVQKQNLLTLCPMKLFLTPLQITTNQYGSAWGKRKSERTHRLTYSSLSKLGKIDPSQQVTPSICSQLLASLGFHCVDVRGNECILAANFTGSPSTTSLSQGADPTGDSTILLHCKLVPAEMRADVKARSKAIALSEAVIEIIHRYTE
ncbi:MAG: hypothetical protein EZS28_013792, partial [Streblomastix strix]